MILYVFIFGRIRIFDVLRSIFTCVRQKKLKYLNLNFFNLKRLRNASGRVLTRPDASCVRAFQKKRVRFNQNHIILKIKYSIELKLYLKKYFKKNTLKKIL